MAGRADERVVRLSGVTTGAGSCGALTRRLIDASVELVDCGFVRE